MSKIPGGDLPGGDRVAEGLRDLSLGLETVPSLLVSIGAPRLNLLGIPVANPISHPELRLYERLSVESPDAAHGRYNALIRKLVSFERAVACGK